MCECGSEKDLIWNTFFMFGSFSDIQFTETHTSNFVCHAFGAWTSYSTPLIWIHSQTNPFHTEAFLSGSPGFFFCFSIQDSLLRVNTQTLYTCSKSEQKLERHLNSALFLITHIHSATHSLSHTHTLVSVVLQVESLACLPILPPLPYSCAANQRIKRREGESKGVFLFFSEKVKTIL